jgi:hemoglobin
VYQQVGGEETFARLAQAFYEGVAKDPVLRPLYPEALEAPADRLGMFLAQVFGGPPMYSLARGHPMLRARHLPFAIGKRERDAWLGHMLAAIDTVGIAEPARSEMRDYFDRAATFMINQVDPDADDVPLAR